MYGISIGFRLNQSYYIYNHYEIFIEINQKEINSNNYQIVGFYIEPISVNQKKISTCVQNDFNRNIYLENITL